MLDWKTTKKASISAAYDVSLASYREKKFTNAAVLEQADFWSMYLLLCQRRLIWLGHVHRMYDGRIPNDIMYDELAKGHCTTFQGHVQ